MVHFYLRIVTFIVGFFIGILLAVQYKNYVNINVPVPDKKTIPSYKVWFEKQNLKRKVLSWDILRYQKFSYFTESQFLYNKMKVLCIILVRKTKNVKAIKDTWSRGCTNIKFIEIFGKGGKVPIKRSKENSSWVLLCQTLRDIKYDFHWIVIVNDNTFVIMENLRYYVANLNSSYKYYLGHSVTFWNTNYNSGDAGYILSNGSVQAFKNKLTGTTCSTNTYWNREDFYLGKHLAHLNITPIDTRDTYGFSTFHPYNWYHAFFPGESYYKYSIFPVKCCSKKSITFQMVVRAELIKYIGRTFTDTSAESAIFCFIIMLFQGAVEGDKMYTYYYLLYTLQIFLNGTVGNKPFIDTVPEDQAWKQFLKERNVPTENVSSAQYYKLWEDLVDDPNSFAAHMKKETDFNYD